MGFISPFPAVRVAPALFPLALLRDVVFLAPLFFAPLFFTLLLFVLLFFDMGIICSFGV
jgi:hypothetical protein